MKQLIVTSFALLAVAGASALAETSTTQQPPVTSSNASAASAVPTKANKADGKKVAHRKHKADKN